VQDELIPTRKHVPALWKRNHKWVRRLA